MVEDTTEPNRRDTDVTDTSLITDITGRLYRSAQSRAERRRRKLREELVREHIQNRQHPRPRLCAYIGKLIKRR